MKTQCTTLTRWIICFAMVVLTMLRPAHAEQASYGGYEKLQKLSRQAEDRGDITQAIRLNLKLLDMRPHDLNAMVMLSGLYGKAEQPEQQLGWTQKILKQQPANFEALINQGNAMAALGDVQGATVSYDKAACAEPKNPVAPYGLGVLSQAQGNEKEALRYFQSALRLEPDFEDAQFNLAVSLANLGRQNESIGLLRQIIRKNPNAVDAVEMINKLSR